MSRGAYKTFVDFQDMHVQLADKARESSCLSLACKEIRPPGWDAPAFCFNLYHASRLEGLRHGSQCKVALARVIYEWNLVWPVEETEFEESVFSSSAWILRRKSYSLQKQIHLCINSHIHDKSLWVPFINYKLSVLGATSTDGLAVPLELRNVIMPSH